MAANSSPAQPTESGYPTYPLDEALRITTAIKELGGNKVGVGKEFLAKHLKYAPTGPSFVQRLGAAKAFGLIEGRGEYQLTELAKRYFYPTTTRDSQDALVAMLKTPPAFRVVISRYEGGSYPGAEIIGNIMYNDAGIPESWKTKLANIFLRSLETAGPIPIDGVMPPAPIIDPLEAALLSSTAPLTQPPHGAHTFDLPLANNRKVTVTAPIDLKPDEMKRLKAWLPLTFLMDWKPEDKH